MKAKFLIFIDKNLGEQRFGDPTREVTVSPESITADDFK